MVIGNLSNYCWCCGRGSAVAASAQPWPPQAGQWPQAAWLLLAQAGRRTQDNLWFSLAFGLGMFAAYLFSCYLLKRICQNAGGSPGWMIWIPVLQMLPLLRAADMSGWALLWFLIPIANLVVGLIVWARLLQNMGRSPLLALLLFVPLLNLLLVIYLAFVPPPHRRPGANPVETAQRS